MSRLLAPKDDYSPGVAMGERPPIHFITLATNGGRGFAQYIASCARFGIEPIVLGRGQAYTGYTMKIRLLVEVLSGLGPDDIVVVTDSYDLVFQQGPTRLYECYKQYSKPIVFSSEAGSGWPNPVTILPETPDPTYRGLCAGFWMATVQAAQRMLEEAYPDGFWDDVDDQGTFQEWLSKYQDAAVVDWKNELVATAHKDLIKTFFDYSDIWIRNKNTDTYPCALHGTIADMTPVYRTLELPDEHHMVWGGRSQQMFAVHKLAFANPWPATMPVVPEDGEALFGHGNVRMLSRVLKESKVRVILELGSWVGMGSTKFFLENEDFNGTIICNDTWKDGSPEMVEGRPEKIATLYETFCRNNWIHRNRIIPLRQDTLEGIATVSMFGILPDLVYVDANHQYDRVKEQLQLIHRLFPDSILTGDDWKTWPQVRKAVIAFAKGNGFAIEEDENLWMLKKR